VAAPTPPGAVPPPPVPPPPVPGPAPTTGNGCLKAFLVAVAVLFVVGAVLVIAFAVFATHEVHKAAKAFNDQVLTPIAAEQHYEQQTGIASYPLGFDATNPPQLDIWKRPLSCTYDTASQTATASGTVQNHSPNAASYLIAVEFQRGGGDVGGAADGVARVDPGATAPWRATGPVTGPGVVTCRVTLVLRGPGDAIPTTTTG